MVKHASLCVCFNCHLMKTNIIRNIFIPKLQKRAFTYVRLNLYLIWVLVMMYFNVGLVMIWNGALYKHQYETSQLVVYGLSFDWTRYHCVRTHVFLLRWLTSIKMYIFTNMLFFVCWYFKTSWSSVFKSVLSNHFAFWHLDKQ